MSQSYKLNAIVDFSTLQNDSTLLKQKSRMCSLLWTSLFAYVLNINYNYLNISHKEHAFNQQQTLDCSMWQTNLFVVCTCFIRRLLLILNVKKTFYLTTRIHTCIVHTYHSLPTLLRFYICSYTNDHTIFKFLFFKMLIKI